MNHNVLFRIAILLAGMATYARAEQPALVLHLDAASIDGHEDGARLEIWKDASAQGHDVKQAEPARRPVVKTKALNGKNVVVFAGQQVLDGPAVLPEGCDSLTIAAVWQRDQAGGAEVIVEQASPGVGRRASLLTVDRAYGFNGEFNDQHGLVPFEPGKFAVSVLRLRDDGLVSLLHNGLQRRGRIDIQKENLGTGQLRIGGKVVGGELLRGSIAEIRVYRGALGDEEAGQLSAELAAKWGLELDARDPELIAYEAMIRRSQADPQRYTEPYREQYHYSPIEGWMNDPNGLCYFGGLWHLFMQHRAPGVGVSELCWGHAVSDDLVHWRHLPPAILSDELGAIWSGSAVVDRNDSSGLFGGKPGLVCIYTYFDPSDNRQSQGLAYSPDGLHFSKYAKNPVLPQLRHQPGQPDDRDFRDPKIFWHPPTERWIMVVAGGTLRFYSSPNLRDWTFESINQDIHTECPDFFELPIDGDAQDARWVLSGGGSWYRLGTFEGHVFKPAEGQFPFNHGGDFYASQTWSDAPDGRRIMISWLFNWGRDRWPTRPFSGGSMTLPYELSLRQTADGPRIYSLPVKEVESLRGQPWHFGEQILSPGSNLLSGVRGKTLEIVAEFELAAGGAEADASAAAVPGKGAIRFGFKVPADGDRQTSIGYVTAAGRLFVDRREAGFAEVPGFNEWFTAPLAPQMRRIKLRLLLDGSSVEAFGNDGAAVITSLILPDPERDGVQLFAEGGDVRLVSLDVYPLESIWRPREGK